MGIGYIILSIFMNVVLFFIGTSTINTSFQNITKRRYKKLLFLFSLILWQVYILIIGKSGILQDYSFPPRVLLLCVLPAFLFTGIFLFQNKNNPWINNIPSHWLIFYQTFRIGIETLFVFSVAEGILPELVTIKGYNFDLFLAITAPIIGIYLYLKKTNSIKIALIWNYFGLLVIASIIFLFVTSIYFPQCYGSKTDLMPKEFGLYPYPTVPSFLMPSAVFIHILSIIQLSKKNNLNN